MSSRGRPVNCRLYFPGIQDDLEKWLKTQITGGDADDYIWDRLESLDPPETQRAFRYPLEYAIQDGAFDDAVRARAKELGLVEETENG